MKKYIYITFLLIFSIGYSQKDEPLYLKGNFKITAIDSLKNYYYLISAVNNDSLFIKIFIKKPSRRVLKKTRKDKEYSKIMLNKNYYFNLESMTWNMGYLPTEKIIMEHNTVIWDRKTSNFFVYETKEFKGLYLKK